MERDLIKMDNETAKKQYEKLFQVFQNFINHKREVKALFGSNFDFNKADERHEETMKEYKERDELNRKIKKEFIEYGRYLSHYLKLQELGVVTVSEESIREYKNLEAYLDGSDEVDSFDYYFQFKDKLYTLDVSSDLKSFGLSPNYTSKFNKNAYYCEIRECKDYLDCQGTKRLLSFIYDKESNKVLDILDITSYEEEKKAIRNDGEIIIKK